MAAPQLYRQLESQLSQWIKPKDKRHLLTFSENVAAILQAQSACLSHWIKFLSHRGCQARSHLERLQYFINNANITPEIFYVPLITHFLQAWSGESIILTLDTSMLWGQYCLIEVCMAWGGRSFPLAQTVIEHASATVGFEVYRPVLEAAQAVIPIDCEVTLLADRGFEHGALIRWLQAQQWSWAIRAKSDLSVTLANGTVETVGNLLPPEQQAYLFSNVEILDSIPCHLATATLSLAQDSWAVVSNIPASLQTFALYGQRFGGIEPHFKDYKSAGFEVLRSGVRGAEALTRLFMLLAVATVIAISVAIQMMAQGKRSRIDWHGHRGLSFVQIGLRHIQQRCYNRLSVPRFRKLPTCNPPPAYASRRKKEQLRTRIQFDRVLAF